MIPIAHCCYAKFKDSQIQFRFAFRLNEPIFLFYLLLLPLWFSACTDEEITWKRIESNGVLRIGLDPTYPPFEMTDGQNLWGLDVELSKALVEELGLTAAFTYFGYDGLYDALGTQQVDVLISALVVVPEKTRDFGYSGSYFNAGQVLVTLDEDEIIDVSNLDGHTVVVELGSQGHVLTTRLQRQTQSLNIITFASSDLALGAVVDGIGDAAIVDHVSARLYRRKEPRLVISNQFLTDEPYALVVRSQDEELLERLDLALLNLQASGQLRKIVSAWLDKA
jgi:polar amino acid transport system substrate-binding protein